MGMLRPVPGPRFQAALPTSQCTLTPIFSNSNILRVLQLFASFEVMVSCDNDMFLLPVTGRMSLSVFAMENIGTPARLLDCGGAPRVGVALE